MLAAVLLILLSLKSSTGFKKYIIRTPRPYFPRPYFPSMISPLFSSSPPYIEDVEYNKSLFSTKNGLFDTRGHGILRVRCKEFGPPLYRFAYMPMRNRGEIIRLMLEEAEVPYEVEVIGFKDWEEGVKGTTPQGKCPVLRNYDGKGNDLGQESAITRFLAGQLGLDGESAVERAQMDSLYCLWFSTMRNNGVSHDGNEFSVAALVDAEGSKSEGRPTYQETFRINDLDKAGRSLLILDYFEEQVRMKTAQRQRCQGGGLRAYLIH